MRKTYSFDELESAFEKDEIEIEFADISGSKVGQEFFDNVTIWTNVYCDSVIFYGIDFRECEFQDCGFYNCKFVGCTFDDILFDWTELSNVQFEMCDIKDFKFIGDMPVRYCTLADCTTDESASQMTQIYDFI